MPSSASYSHRASFSKDKKDKVGSSMGAVEVQSADVVEDVEAQGEKAVQQEGTFGNGGEDEVEYTTVGWFFTGLLLTKVMIGLGVLTIPSTFHVLGLAPGVLIMVAIAIMTTWTDYYIGIFKTKHMEVYSLADCGRLMFGKWGSYTFGAAYWLFTTFVAGSAFIGISTALNAISIHGTCTVVFVTVAAVVTYPFAALPRLENIKWLSWVGLLSIVPSILLVTIAVAAGGRPSPAPQTGPLDLQLVMWGNPSFAEAMGAVANLAFAFSGTPVFLPIASEMRRPQDFHKSVFLCQGFCTAFYLLVGIVMYNYAGVYVASPALGTAGELIKRVAYGIALPGLFVTAIIYVHLSGKAIFVRALRHSVHLTRKTRTHYLAWFGSTFGCLVFSYIVAEAIPVFGGLIGLIGALFGTLLTFHAEACMYLYDVWGTFRHPEQRTKKLWTGVIGNVLLLLIGTFLLIGGCYGSVHVIKESYDEAGGRPFSCADNSNST
ncbi:hypothetical protein JCM8547_000667 [Rhodosporidiobolus lusitaniae]